MLLAQSRVQGFHIGFASTSEQWCKHHEQTSGVLHMSLVAILCLQPWLFTTNHMRERWKRGYIRRGAD